MHLKLQPDRALWRLVLSVMHVTAQRRVVCTYVVAHGRAVVKGLNILYLVVLREAFCSSVDRNQLVRVEWPFVFSLSSKMQWAKSLSGKQFLPTPHEQKVMVAVSETKGGKW